MLSACAADARSVTPSESNTTSPIEELPGIFSRKSKVSRNAAKKLYDVSYMIYRREKEEEEGRREAWQEIRKEETRREKAEEPGV